MRAAAARRPARGGAWVSAAVLAAVACRAPLRDVPPAPGFAAAAEDLAAFVRAEMEDGGVPGVALAVADGGRVVWARGFGVADPAGGGTMHAEHVVRAGSVSKLFTATAVMLLVEDGLVELDAPVRRYLSDFAPRSRWRSPVTVRHLLTHRAGLVREPPVGHYFDPSEPSLEATVASLNETDLVYEPGTRRKYSNAGPAVAGLIVQRVAGVPFEDFVTQRILGPLQLEHVGFAASGALASRRAAGTMWTLDGRRFPAPEFDLGTGPAGNLYGSVVDLVRFASGWEAGGTSVLAAGSLAAMLGTRGGEPGLAFFRDSLDGRLRVGHGGAIYGFATEVAALPEEDAAVAVAVTLDFANGTARRIADRALRWVLAAREGAGVAPPPALLPVGRERARSLAGVYDDGATRVRLRETGGELELEPPAGLRALLRQRPGGERRLVVHDVFASGEEVAVDGGSLRYRGAVLPRAPDARPPPPPERWRELIGEYGWDHDVLYVLERAGRLHVLIEWFASYPLAERGSDRFVLPDRGLYAGEPVSFGRDASGAVTHVTVGAVRFDRRRLPGDGATFHVTPVVPRDELRARAAAADPPDEVGPLRRPDLVDLEALEPSLQLDVRYATTNNFLRTKLYREARALLQRPAAEALVRAHRRLGEQGYGLVVYDGYRPWFVTKMFWDATPEGLREFVADPTRGSRHNRGCAADVGLFERETGAVAPMPSGYDEFTPRAYPRYPGGTSLERWHRELLRAAMEEEAFTVYEREWWHFDWAGWREYPILNVPFR